MDESITKSITFESFMEFNSAKLYNKINSMNNF